MTTLLTPRTHDHRIREVICETGDPGLFPELKIPRSTVRSWLHRGIPDVVTCDSLSAEKTELLTELQELRRRAAVLGAMVGLLVAILRVSERRLDHERLPEGNGKRALLRASERAGWYRGGGLWRLRSGPRSWGVATAAGGVQTVQRCSREATL